MSMYAYVYVYMFVACVLWYGAIKHQPQILEWVLWHNWSDVMLAIPLVEHPTSLISVCSHAPSIFFGIYSHFISNKKGKSILNVQ